MTGRAGRSPHVASPSPLTPLHKGEGTRAELDQISPSTDTTLATALRAATRALAAAGVPDPGADARILLLAAAGLDRLALVLDPGRAMPEGAAPRLDAWIARRAAREPVSRILGRREFWSMALRVTPDVLDPRPDTETVVEAALAGVGDRRGAPLRVLDLGTGSGAILCALLAELPRAVGWAVDMSEGACRVARGNLVAHGFAARSLVLRADWGAALAGGFDVVASNPPYVETAVIAGLDPDVRDHDPMTALDGGADGLACYRALAAELPRLLARGGVACFEVGRGQDGAVAAVMAEAGLGGIEARLDLAGIARAVVGRQPP